MVESYADKIDQINELDFKPLPWSAADLDLLPGSILRFTHVRSPISYIFECTGLKGGRMTSGQLIGLHDGRVQETQKAEVSLVHFIPTMSGPNTKFAQFTFQDRDKTVKVTPVFTTAEITFEPTIARQVFIEEAIRQERDPFVSPTAKTTLARAQSYFMQKAEVMAADTDYSNANRYRTAAEIIGGLILDVRSE